MNCRVTCESRSHTLRRLLHISLDTTAFPWAKRTPIRGLQSVIAVAVALVAGKLSGHASAGAIAAGAAFTIGFALFHEALASTLLSMAIVTLGLASGTLAGSLGAGIPALVLILAIIASINYGLLADLGTTSSWIGQQCAVFVVIASYFPLGVHYAVGRTEMVLAGGGLQMLFYTAFHLHRLHPRAISARPAVLPLLRARALRILKQVRQDLTWGSSMVSYILRLVLAVGLSSAIYQTFHIRNGYWAPMTALLVLKPQWSNTLSRGIARLFGTLLGAGVALMFALWVPLPAWFTFTLCVIAAWGCYATQAVNYALFSFSITLYIVFLFRFGGFSDRSAAHLRLVNTAIGGGIALAIDLLWRLLGHGTELEVQPAQADIHGGQ
jgi:hypothetical protein